MSGEIKVGARHRFLSWPVFGLTLGALIAGTGAAQAAGPVLPTGGKVVNGSAVIGAPGAGALTVTQSSSKAILDWSSFSIGAGGKVAFDNGSGATLNRVTGGSVSSLDGLLSATGSVYLINPNGVIIGKSGVVDVGGTFVASTLDTPDAGFLKGGALGFSGASTASVVNLGKVGALGGDVALIAAQVSNAGSISAANGSAGLIAGHSVVMLRDGALDEGRFSVLLGGADTSVTNTGLIDSADAELRAEGGNIYALAGDTSGVIRATGVKSGGGKVWLVAEGGELDLAGAISAQGAGGAAGTIETSGGTVKIGSARIDAHGGSWLVDPDDLTIDANAATTIDNALNAGTSVTEQTTASGYSGAGVVSTSGKGDITVAAPITWRTDASLTLSAYRNIDVNASITASGDGTLNLFADNAGMAAGTVNFGSDATVSNRTTYSILNIDYYPMNNVSTSVNPKSYTGGNDYDSHVQGGFELNVVMLVDTVFDLQNIQNNLSGTYALGANINASSTRSWNNGAGFIPIGLGPNAFTGELDGRGYAVSNLFINDATDATVGLFGTNSGELSNIGVLAGTVAGSAAGSSVGMLAGLNLGQIATVSAMGSVSGGGDSSNIGGLVGYNRAGIDTASAAVAVSAAGSTSAVGGLVGYNSPAVDKTGENPGYAEITYSHASGTVTSPGGSLGGLVGVNDGDTGYADVTTSYATGAVTATSDAHSNAGVQIGGLVGYNAGDYGSSFIEKSYATGVVTGGGAAVGGGGLQIGGLVGQNDGRYGDAVIGDSYASGAVAAKDSAGVGFAGIQAGGLVGVNIGDGDAEGYYTSVAQVEASYATGAVNVGAVQSGGSIRAGGLIGYNDGYFGTANVYCAYATGAVRSGAGAQVGGLVGYNYANSGTAYVEDSYFDTQTTLQSSDGALATGSDASTGSIGLTTAQFMDAKSPISGLGLGASDANYVIVDSDGTLNGSNGATRPILLSEYSTTITNAHQLQLIALDPTATYTLAANIVASGTANPSDVWGPAGFVPVGQASAPFSGTLNGAGHTVTSLTINDASGTDVGLIGDLDAGGVVESLTLSGNVTGGTNVGALVGYNSGMVTGSSGKGSVRGASDVGGVVGYNSALVSGSYGKATVSGTETANASPSQNVGGFVGLNAGSLTSDYATGAVTGEGSVGGLAGSNTGIISKSYATGAVSSVSGKSFLQNSLGGLVGSNGATLTDDYATGAVSGNEQVGGLVGYNSSIGVISVAYATGAAKGLTGNGAPSGSGVDVGGLVGENAGSTANTYATGAVSGSSGKGGLVGVNDQGATVATSYATGKGGFGFAGANNGTLISDVFDTNTTGTSTGVGSGSNTGATGIGGSTGLDPDQTSSYSGFDFTSIWTIQPGSSRPYLMAIPQSAPPT